MIDQHDWHGFERLLSDMGRARHAVQNAWEASQAERTAEFEAEIAARVRRVLEYREWQLRRLQQFNEETGGRLQLISRWKAYARSVAGRRQNRAALFTDVR
ncbi:MAG TPA: hypothetical protein VMG98_03355 [Verrucomicrobiae bacterium]|nr:hypothetical protein [Verrucomicrobiae bacterium]